MTAVTLFEKIVAHVARLEFIALNYPSAAVPSQDRVVVSRGSDSLSFVKTIHCLAEHLKGIHAVLRQDRFCPTLINDARVIDASILVLYPRQKFLYVRVADRIVLAKSISHRQYDVDQRFLIFGVDREDVEANALGRGRLVQQAIVAGLFEGSGNGFLGKWLEIEHGELLSPKQLHQFCERIVVFVDDPFL